MGESIKRRVNGIANKNDAFELRKLLDAALADIAALRADMANRVANHNTLIAKLNLDGGVTDTNYAAATAATSTTANLEA